MYSRLLVPLDGSPTANLALHHAAALARLSGATTVLPMGSDAEQLARIAPVPVMLVRHATAVHRQGGTPA